MNPFPFLVWPMFQQAMLQYCEQTAIFLTRAFLSPMAKALVPQPLDAAWSCSSRIHRTTDMRPVGTLLEWPHSGHVSTNSRAPVIRSARILSGETL
jgi:hypothetical protein